MKLPNADRGIFEREKIVDYLLNPTHPDNGGKAEFFFSLGFNNEDWDTFGRALRRVAEEVETTKSMESKYGMKYIIDGRIKSPSGRTAKVRTIWIVNTGFDVPRLVTAYPIEE